MILSKYSVAGWIAAFTILPSVLGQVVINEIHYDSPVKTEHVEFIELHNAGAATVDLSGWVFTDGIEYTFPGGTSIAPGEYLVVGQSPAAIQAKFGITALGPFEGRLANEGEEIDLRDASGELRDRVDYQLGFPWPTVGEPPGYSIELIDPSLDNELGGSWRASVRGDPSGTISAILASGSTWRYFPGRSEPSIPSTAWRGFNFDDSGWEVGTAPIGYGDSWVATPLDDMQGNYSSVYFRNEFQVENPSEIGTLLLESQYDDGFKLWINGVHVHDANASGGEVPYTGTANSALENGDFVQFAIGNASAFLRQGRNVIAVQGFNASLGGSSDFWMDFRLLAEVGPATRGPTPGALNSVDSPTAPPQLRQVNHSPNEPRSGEPVLITVKATDPQGVQSIDLSYQVLGPGAYIALEDAEYETSWTSLAMNDDGSGGDEVAGDDIWSATLPSSIQQHRRLIRYRIVAADGDGATIRAPYLDDPQPNFAYFVYDGAPAWGGAARPGVTSSFTVPADEMNRLPIYHLVSKRSDVEDCTWYDRYGGDVYRYPGTLIYDGVVYDHIGYRARGGVWRFSMGKNMWKFDFNRGHGFQARDNWGEEYKVPWTKLNLGASIQQGDFDHRGEQGMFESVGFRMFNMAGVEAPETTFITFRIVDEAAETVSNDQYRGDFWGVYLAMEQMNGRFLDQHDLPDGNLYKMENGTGPPGASGESNNQGPAQVSDSSDLINFRNMYLNQNPSDAWYRQNFDLERYYSYQAILQGIHHYDVCCGKNYFYYHNPETGQWQVHPWDLDLTWADNMYVGGVTGGTEPFQSRVLSRTTFRREWANRIREIRDLLFNTDEAWRLIEEYGRLLQGPGGNSVLDADRAQWDYNPLMVNSGIVNTGKAGHGRFYQFPRESVPRTFEGAIELMKDYVVYRSNMILDPESFEPGIPATPTPSYVGEAGYPVTGLRFRSSLFQGQGQFESMQWRIAEVTPEGAAFDPSEPQKYEINAEWESPVITTFNAEMTFPAGALKVGKTYRARVRMTDTLGRASHWSAPIEFVAGEPANSDSLVEFLKITELMYHAPLGSEFDFIELRNLSGDLALSLSGATFTEGIDFTFPVDFELAPGERVVLTEHLDPAVFRAHYGLSGDVTVLGPWDGSLSNGGERLTLKTASAGAVIATFQYQDGWGWPVSADGAGHSLVPTSEDVGSALLDYGGHWRASGWIGGSPGDEDVQPARSAMLTEIMAHTDYEDPSAPEYDSNDWIELENRSETSVSLGGWYLSDDGNDLKKWAFPSGLVLGVNERMSVDEVTDFHQPISTGFGLNKAGETVFLSHFPDGQLGRVVDAARFPGLPADQSWSRHGMSDYWQMTPPTRNAANAIPAGRPFLSEIMYHPEEMSEEYIEIHNPLGAPVPFFDTNGVWRVDGAVEFLFPDDFELAGGSTVLVVPFDPGDSVAVNAFRSHYGLEDQSVQFLGPYSGVLDNAGERVSLQRPQTGDEPLAPVSWIVLDEVIYFDQLPWPPAADGNGSSLERGNAMIPGSDPGAWGVDLPSPGQHNGPTLDLDSDEDGMPDDWENQFGLDPFNAADATGDFDQDGVTNLDEFLSGTDPTDETSALRLIVEASDGSVALRFYGESGRSYSVLRSGSLDSDWEPLATAPAEAGGRWIDVTDSQPSGESFYRVVTPALTNP